MAGRVYKDTSLEAAKRRERQREANHRYSARHPKPKKRPVFSGMSAEEIAEFKLKAKKAKAARQMAEYNGVAKDGIVTPAHIQHDEPLSRYIADRMVRQEAGISTKPGFNIIGDGCFRARPHRSHT